MKDLKFKHFFSVVNNHIIWERPDMLQTKKLLLEGKKGYAIIEEVQEDITVNQYAFYFGGIINGECMNSNCFAGLRDYEIHQILFREVTSYTRTVEDVQGNSRIEVVTDDFHSYGRRKMAWYIDKLIPHLQNEYGINVKDPSEYKLNKFIIRNRKTYGKGKTGTKQN